MKTDLQLQGDVMDELNWCPNVDAAHIGVTAKHGVVTLTGQVPHYAERRAAETATKRVAGVLGLANDIRVEVAGDSKRSDEDIANAALSALSWDVEVPREAVTVVVKSGWLTLEGEVAWQFQRDAAYRCVRNLRGVIAVSNNLHIKAAVRSMDVKQNIEKAFHRHADLEFHRIAVSTVGQTVILKGSVATWGEREAAQWAAWAAPGVSEVHNQLTVTPQLSAA